MILTLEEVQHIANLARLELTDEESVRYRKQLSQILEYFQLIQIVDTDDLHPNLGSSNLESTLRADVSAPGLELQDALRNAADSERDQFRVPPVFE
jgi:aspartyl-tRNA(Asn)/glutamyl-tRNA(Gln) amidotransferase subunit C